MENIDERITTERIIEGEHMSLLQCGRSHLKFERLPEDTPSGKIFYGNLYSDEYFWAHEQVILFMKSKEVFEALKRKTEENKGKRGYVALLVEEKDGVMNISATWFVAFHIIRKAWGMYYKDAKVDDFCYFHCLYKNDFTQFRGCIKK